jgi:hypothetical protein
MQGKGTAWASAALIAGGALAGAPVQANTPITMSETEAAAPTLPAILAPRERAALENRILAERLDTIIPAIMRAEGIDLWLLVAREYFEEPVVAVRSAMACPSRQQPKAQSMACPLLGSEVDLRRELSVFRLVP